MALASAPSGLPSRQHAWTATLALDSEGNPISPRFDRLLFFDVAGTPSPAYARVLEAALRTLERTYQWGPSGLLFTAGWGPSYFERCLRTTSPIPVATALSDFELPAIDDYDVCLHLACDDEQRLAAVEAALIHGAALPGADGPLDLSSVLTWRETRTGFVGAGLPAANQNVGGIPPGNPVAKGVPLFMGFKSAFRKNQATEDDVTLAARPLRRRHHHARQLHAPAPRQLVSGPLRPRAGGPHVRAPGDPRAGQPVHDRRAERSEPARPGDQPLRGHRALPDVRHRPAQRAGP